MIPFAISFIIWAVVHSITAAKSTKAFVRRQFGERVFAGWYRLIYNIFAVLTFVPVLYFLWTGFPTRVMWIIPTPWRYGTMFVQVLALLGLAASLLQTDVWAFVGLRQAVRYLQGEAEPELPAQFVQTGPYAWVRHPLYTFSLLFLWLNPVMGLSSLVLNLFATAYFWIGSVYEERRLEREFGEAYRSYKARVPRLVPTRRPS